MSCSCFIPRRPPIALAVAIAGNLVAWHNSVIRACPRVSAEIAARPVLSKTFLSRMHNMNITACCSGVKAEMAVVARLPKRTALSYGGPKTNFAPFCLLPCRPRIRPAARCGASRQWSQPKAGKLLTAVGYGHRISAKHCRRTWISRRLLLHFLWPLPPPSSPFGAGDNGSAFPSITPFAPVVLFVASHHHPIAAKLVMAPNSDCSIAGSERWHCHFVISLGVFDTCAVSRRHYLGISIFGEAQRTCQG